MAHTPSDPEDEGHNEEEEQQQQPPDERLGTFITRRGGHRGSIRATQVCKQPFFIRILMNLAA